MKRYNQQGITLIEIMISLLIGVFLIGGVVQIFISTKQTYRVQENLARFQENGRFAMEFLMRDIRMADFAGCLQGGLSSVVNNLDPSGVGYDSNIHLFTQGIEGTNGVDDAADSITLRGAMGGIPVEAPFGPQASANIKVAATNGLAQSDIVLVSNCSQGDIIQITNANPNTSGTLVHNTGNATQPGNYNASNPGCPGGNAHCLSTVYQDGSAIYTIQTIKYSIQDAANGQPSLFKKIGSANAIELIEGIENMQILYGEDTDADNTANYYVPAGTGGLNMDQVVSIRISLLVRSMDDNLTSEPRAYNYNGASTTPTDRRLRRVFSSTIAVRNRLP